MKGFAIKTEIEEYSTFEEYAKEAELGANDLILCGKHTYDVYIAPLSIEVQTLFRDKYGSGEPTDGMVDAILDDLRDKKYDRIIAIGGGTVIDIAKAVAVAGPEDKVDDLYDHVADLKQAHPLTIVPTTCGTGSEVTNISVINRVSKGVKMGLAAEAMLPDKAVLITNMLDSMPYKVFATSSIDAMVHSAESFLSPNGCSISRIFSTEALKLILASWKKFTEEGGGDAWKKYAADFLKASNWAGIGFGYAGCAAVHACAYPLGSVYHIPHGQSNQLMFKAVMVKYKEVQPVGRINDLEKVIAEVLGTKPEDALETLYALMDKVLLKEPLKNFGVKEEDLPVFAKDVIETQQRLLRNNYVELSQDDLLEIYQAGY
jgi:4-hydroxybutyrate dehydrogenase